MNHWFIWRCMESFDLTPAYFKDMRVLDVGCGPRGSLEWADMAAERVGLDPLVPVYRWFGTSRHQMRYVAGHAEKMPFADNRFEIITCLNALDHVDDLDAVIAEIKRVIAPGGTLLLMTDFHAEPRVCEPVTFGYDVVTRFSPEFRLVRLVLYEAVKDCQPTRKSWDHLNPTCRPGRLRAILISRDTVADGCP